MAFDTLGLGPNVLKAISDAGYTEPTPIQAAAIPIVLGGRDLVGIAQTGTGKTASFTLPMIEKLSKGRARARMPRSLILEPTRELAAQVAENFETYGKYHKLNMALLIGGVSFAEQEKKLDRGADVLIATPGRLLDHAQNGKVVLTGVQILVIDEADRMLDMGFIPDIEQICKLIPFTRQTLLFSATMPPEIENLANNFQQNPEKVEVSRPASTATTVTQRLVETTAADKRETLRSILDTEDVKNAIIFCNRKKDVSIVYKSLTKHGYSAGALHGDLDQSVRMRTLEGFRNGEISLLVASDVAARGLDIPTVGHVFNFDVPSHAEDYVHRIGRTGRAGREGAAFTLVCRSDKKYLDAIVKLIGTEIEKDDRFSGKPAAEAKSSDADDSASEEDDKPARSSRRSSSRSDNRSSGSSRSDGSRSDGGRPEGGRSDGSRSSRGGGRRTSRDDDDKPVVGLGDHVPAFLLRPVKLPSKSAKDADLDTETTDGDAPAEA